jgi:3-oxoacyl-[acyl-carrier protein] reductase
MLRKRGLPLMRLSGIHNRVAFVTGAGRGIGARIAQTLSRLGARVAAGDLIAPSIDGLFGIRVDVSDFESVDDAFRRIETDLGDVEILVLNAGVFSIQALEDTTLESWRCTMSVNLDGAFLCARRALPSMRSHGYGRLVVVGSAAGITGGSVPCAAYAASKAGMMALAKAIAAEYGKWGITCNAVAPALIRTEMMNDTASLSDRIVVGRVGEPADVADAVAFLSSGHAGYITGEILDVNGGFLID